MPQIRIPPVLRPEAGGNRTVDVEAATVREALDRLVTQFPALKSRVLEGDGVPSFLNVFVDGDDIRISGGTRLRGATTDSLDDHRLAMTFAVAGLLATGETTVLRPASAAISYPGFFDDLGRVST